jgi:type I restriction enzyme S subunit
MDDGSDFPEWEDKKLGDICEKISTKNTIDNQNVLTISAQHGLINQLDFFDKKVSSSNLKNYFLLKRDDFAYNKSYSKGYPFGAIKRLKFYPSGVVSPLYICFRTKKDKSLFLEYVFEGSLIDYEIQKIAQEGARNHGLLNISITDFFDKISLKIPSIQEQEKIAGFLTAVDELIADLTKKESLLQKYKKGVMQKIFSQELRFKQDDGSDYPEWEEKKLGDVATIVMGQSPNSTYYNMDKIGLPLIQGNADCKNRKTSPKIFTSQKTKECHIGDIIMSVRAPVGSISMAEHNACIGRGVCFIKNKTEILQSFLYQILVYSERLWSSISQGSTFESVGSKDIYFFSLNIPTHLEEQEKIASFLTAIDDQITTIQQQLEKTKQYKKALLQQLFI